MMFGGTNKGNQRFPLNPSLASPPYTKVELVQNDRLLEFDSCKKPRIKIPVTYRFKLLGRDLTQRENRRFP